MTRIVIIGGGPGGYEAALVAAQLGADVTLVERDGVGGACVLVDCVPSKTLIATSDTMTTLAGAAALGVRLRGADPLPAASWASGAEITPPQVAQVDLVEVNTRVKRLAAAQSTDIGRRLEREGVTVLLGAARLVTSRQVEVTAADGTAQTIEADVVLVATGATPRVLAGAEPDGDRILTWRQLYDLQELPEHLVVIGSGVTGAEFANAYRALGSAVTLVSSRDRVLPGEDADAAEVIQDVFTRRGVHVANRSRAAGVKATADGVVVTLTDGTTVTGSHALMTVGSVPNTADLGLAEIGVRLAGGGFIETDRVSRTSVNGVYAAGDCTGVLMLASVAAMQGRIAMWHALGEAVTPLRLSTVAANVFTSPEIATVGVSQAAVDAGSTVARSVMLPLATNPRAKMEGITDGFVKCFVRPGSGAVLGGVVVAPKASELILTLSAAVQNGLTVDQLAHTFSIYPSLSGSLTESARQLMEHQDD